MSEFKRYQLKQKGEMRPYVEGEDLSRIKIARVLPAPVIGDMIARDPDDHEEQWLIKARFFADKYEPAE